MFEGKVKQMRVILVVKVKEKEVVEREVKFPSLGFKSVMAVYLLLMLRSKH